MNATYELIPEPVHAIRLFEPDLQTALTIETAARVVGVSRHTILVYCRRGLIACVDDPERRGYSFDYRAIQLLRRIEYLRHVCGVNLAGIKMILDLTNQLERVPADAGRF